MGLWRNAVFALSMMLLVGCSQDMGLNYKVEEIVEEVVVEEIIEEIVEETVGESVVEQGYIYNQALDILFIVDESGSMSYEQELIVNYLPDMYSVLTGPDFTDLDWRVMLRSADPDIEPYGWVSWDDPNPNYSLHALFTFLGSTAWLEQGLDVAIQSTAFDTEFHRPEADLLIIFVSDEPDQSFISVSTYESLISTYKTYPFETTEAAIVYSDSDIVDYPDCVVEQTGTGYIDVSEQVVSFCNPAVWEDIMYEAKAHVPTLNEEWPLSEVPYDPSAIQVFADAEEWFDWRYDNQSNTVFLTDIPEAGTLITIVYVKEVSDTGDSGN
jgi:hypothetical protein